MLDVPACEQSYIRADLDGAIFAYNCCMRLAHFMSATRIMSSKSGIQNLHYSWTQHKRCCTILKPVLNLMTVVASFKMLE